jgi:uncharacterized protein GlcG (DUF336 family)
MKSIRFRLERLEDRTLPDASLLGTAWRPVTGSWNGQTNGIGSFDPVTATWFLRNEVSPGAPDASAPFAYGAPGWTPLAGDWNGNGSSSVGIFDPNTATFYLRNENSAGAPDAGMFQFGAPGWIPLAGDWSGSGHTGIGVFDPTTATFYLRNTDTPGAPDLRFTYGLPGWRPVVGDWNGLGRTTIGMIDPGTSTWYLRDSNSAGAPDHAAPFAYGLPGWLDFTNHQRGGPDGIGVLDPGTASWFLRMEASAGWPDAAPAFAYGVGGTADPPPPLASTGNASTGPNQLLGLTPSPQVTLTAAEVGALLQRAAAATASDDGIVALVDRGGRVLGVRVEGGVSPAITGNLEKLVFSIDGAVSEARTGAFFGNDQAPLTSRTIEFLSQTTITQREVESDPSVADPDSTLRGPGFVAPIGIGGHFPPGVPYTPSADLFDIEATNRDTTVHLGPSGVPGGADSTLLSERFNVNPADIPSSIPASQQLAAPDSYGFVSGLEPNAQPRGIGTLPGGIPILENGLVVGGIGVFFPGATGYADEENAHLKGATWNPAKPDRAEEAEYVAFAALGGDPEFPVGALGAVNPVPGIGLPSANARIDLVGVTLDIIGPGGTQGPANLVSFATHLGPGQGNPNSGFLAPLQNPGPSGQYGQPGATAAPGNLRDGTLVPEGFLVTPHDGAGITANQVQQVIQQAVLQANDTRAAIRLPANSPTRMVIAVADRTGEIVGLFRMPDATVFSIDVAVAKARNVAYYDDAAAVQGADQVSGVSPGTAFSNRTFRYLAQPYFPEGINGDAPGPFSILEDPGSDPTTGLNSGAPLPASAFTSVMGHDAFFPETNFHDTSNVNDQNGVVFFPGSAPLYVGGTLIGGVGISGDGVNQDDFVTSGGVQGFGPPGSVTTADQVFVRGVRLPYQNFPRNPNL